VLVAAAHALDEIAKAHQILVGKPHLRGDGGLAKVVIAKTTDRVIGAHLVGHAGEELIHIFALAMKRGITAGGLGDLVYEFPAFSADIKSML
jgi:pyruvate/2-oxoglutarate dehydrogenase complex dihydrolipoamide dehydrogenase (E3) component